VAVFFALEARRYLTAAPPCNVNCLWLAKSML
jgi:hypothetical protein